MNPAWLVVLFLAQTGSVAPADTDASAAVSETPGAEDTSADPADIAAAVQELAVSRNAEAGRLLAKKKYPEALAMYLDAHGLAPENPEITNNLGYIYFLLGNMEEAETYYRRAIELDPSRAVAYMNFADLLMEKFPREIAYANEAAKLLVKARELQGNKPQVIIRQARVEMARSNYPAAERYYLEYVNFRPPSDKLKMELGDFYREIGRVEEALSWYRQIAGEDYGRLAAGKIWEIEVEKQNVEFGWNPDALAVPEKSRKLARLAREAFNRQDYEKSRQLFTECLALSPVFAGAHADFGDLYFRIGKLDDAETSYLRALAFEPDNPEYLARLGRLSMAMRGRSSQAVVFISRALELRPQWTDLHLQLALAMRATGNLVGALEHVNLFLSRVENDSRKREKGLSLKKAIETLIPPDSLLGAADPLSEDQEMSPVLSEALRAARLHLRRGELDGAMARLQALPEDLRGIAVLNLESRILLGAGRTREAVEILRQSLRKEERQALIHLQLGQALVELDDQRAGRIHLSRAEKLGDQSATYLLASLDSEDIVGGPLSPFRDLMRLSELVSARDRLGRFLKGSAASLYFEEATALQLRVEERIRLVMISLVSTGILLLVILLLVIVRIRGGINLRQLISRYPETGIQIQRILSAVRHEVLKHHTMMLGGLVQAAEKGEDISDRVAYFTRSFFGDGNVGGVELRLNGYIAELEQIGHSHRRRLALARKDPAIGPLIQGMAIIQRAHPRLARYASMNNRSRGALVAELKQASELLNIRGYEAVRALLDRLRNLEIDRPLLQGIYDRCTREPSFSKVVFKRLVLELPADEKIGIAVPRAAFEDILTNLMRNAIQSTILYGEGGPEVGIGLSVETQIDAVTGIERVAFKVKDRSSRVLTAEMLRGRYIEEGLGLTADLVTRYDGTLDVAQGDYFWAKSVVVKLPRAEDGTSTGE